MFDSLQLKPKGISTESLKHWPVVIVILTFLFILVVGVVLPDKYLGILSAAVLAATFVSVTWYSWETRVLRLKQETDAEIRQHPWLNVEDMGVTRQREPETSSTHETFHFYLRNGGETPALDVTIKGRWSVEAELGSDEPSDNFESTLGTILPNTIAKFDTRIHWELISIITITLDIIYKTIHDGGGRFRYEYSFVNPGIPVVKNESLELWLSDGTRFPVDNAKEKVDT